MNPAIRIALLKELESIKKFRSRNSYPVAWTGLVVSIVWIAQIVYVMSKPERSSAILNGCMMVLALGILLQSFYIIIRHTVDRRMVLIMEALLESKKSFSEASENQTSQV